MIRREDDDDDEPVADSCNDEMPLSLLPVAIICGGLPGGVWAMCNAGNILRRTLIGDGGSYRPLLLAVALAAVAVIGAVVGCCE